MNTADRKNQFLLHLENVYKIYGEKTVLDDVDLSVKEGEFCTVIGPSGCGKSTLLRLILGQEFPSRGHLYLSGEIIGYPDTRRGIVYQRYSLFPHLTVMDNVILSKVLRTPLPQRMGKKKQYRDEAMGYLKRVRLDGHAEKMPHELSGGMQQRVAIAQSLISKPAILLMDEPFGALDPDTREEMQMFLLELWEQQNMTIFFVTHDLEEAVFLGTRVFALSQYYSDDRDPSVGRGAKIVADYQLPRAAASTQVKHDARFQQLMEEIRREAFDPEVLQHARDFNLKHPDSFQTLEEG